MAITQDELAKLEGQYGRVGHIKGKPYPKVGEDPSKAAPAWEVVLRKPTRAEYKRFRSQSHNPQMVADAQEVLARCCCVFPSKEAFDALLEDYPGIPEAATPVIKDLLGLSVDESEKL